MSEEYDYDPFTIYSEATIQEGEIPSPPKPLEYTKKPNGDIELTDESKEVLRKSHEIKMRKISERYSSKEE
jgi:hypothetical protein